MKVYIAGPITGKKNHNQPAFTDAEHRLKLRGYEVVNPHKIDHSKNRYDDWAEYMRVCIRALMDCDAIVLLPDWHESEGAQVEMYIASRLGMPYAIIDDDRITEFRKEQ